MTVIPTTKLPDGSTMPVFGLGTWGMGEHRNMFDAEVAALRAGIDLGVRLIDTAEMYGDAERVVGEAISGRRDDVYLVSKVLPSHASYEGTIKACENSLDRLGTDGLDLYLLHWRGGVPLEETVRGFERLQESGKIARWGVSNFDVEDIEDLEKVSRDCAANQVLYNLTRRGIEYDLLGYCRERSIPIMAYSPIEQGRLAGHKFLGEIAKAHEATPAQIALAWVLDKPGVVAIPKSIRPDTIAQNIGSLEIVLTDADRAMLDTVFAPPRSKHLLEMI